MKIVLVFIAAVASRLIASNDKPLLVRVKRDGIGWNRLGNNISLRKITNGSVKNSGRYLGKVLTHLGHPLQLKISDRYSHRYSKRNVRKIRRY